MPEPRLPASQGRAGLSDQHEGRVVSQGNCGDDVYGTADQQARDCDRSWTGGERGREQPCAARGHRGGDRVGRRHARQVARAHEGREHVAGAPELDAQDGRLSGQKGNSRVRKPDPWRPALHATKSRTVRERFANGRQAENYSLKCTRARPSLRRATSPFSKSVLSLF